MQSMELISLMTHLGGRGSEGLVYKKLSPPMFALASSQIE